jgi:hypothetical protein
MYAPRMSLSLLVGTFKASGLYSPKVQKIIQHHCEAGRIMEIADVVSQVLYDEALQNRSLPEPKGVRTADLVDRMLDGARQLVEIYARRGVLCAKGFLPPAQLALLVVRRWENAFHSVLAGLEADHEIVDGTDPDFLVRSTVAAQAVSELLLRLPRTQEGDLILPMKELEGFCVMAVKKMHAAFVKPNHAVHELLHGEPPKENV